MPKNSEVFALEPLYQKKRYNKTGELSSIVQIVDNTQKLHIEAKNKNIFIPVWIIGLYSAFAAAIIILFAASIYLNTVPRAALYTESCASRSCLSGLNTRCLHGICSCLSNQYFMKGCVYKSNYSQFCPLSDSSYCTNGLDLVCLDGICQCNSTSRWNGFYCVPKNNYDGFCTNDDYCYVDTKVYYI
jgi:hypothetical protein